MDNLRRSFAASAALMVSASAAHAASLQCRWVERIGNQDFVIGGDGATLGSVFGVPRRIRLQFGVFDDASGPAPAGGFLGWFGRLDVPNGSVTTTNTRTPGRLAPFTFSTNPNANGNPPLPGGDPFHTLTDIDNTLGQFSPFWGCDQNGNPLPQPPPVIRGRNEFVSVYEFTTLANGFLGGGYTITVQGFVYTASEWRILGTPIPPDCDTQTPGAINYVPLPIVPAPMFTCTLNVDVPNPGAAAIVGAGALLISGRRRSRTV